MGPEQYRSLSLFEPKRLNGDPTWRDSCRHRTNGCDPHFELRYAPNARLSSLLRWEGIVIDPVGAVLAVLVFEQPDFG